MKPHSLYLCRAVVGCCGLLLCAMNVAAGVAAGQAPEQQPLGDALQMVLVTTPDWNAVDGRLQRYERGRPGTQWKHVGEPIEIVVGKKGTGWGVGLVSTDAPGVRKATDPVKKEGDGKSPAGAFNFSSAFGYAAQAPTDWKLPYIPLTASVECVDDSGSKFYNRIVDRTTVSPDWHSSEQMASAGAAYRWGAVIDNNANPPTPLVGSCVFMHVWGGAGVGTAGCTAMPQAQLEPILAWLDPAARPVLVQLPMAQYKKLKKLWRLP